MGKVVDTEALATLRLDATPLAIARQHDLATVLHVCDQLHVHREVLRIPDDDVVEHAAGRAFEAGKGPLVADAAGEGVAGAAAEVVVRQRGTQRLDDRGIDRDGLALGVGVGAGVLVLNDERVWHVLTHGAFLHDLPANGRVDRHAVAGLGPDGARGEGVDQTSAVLVGEGVVELDGVADREGIGVDDRDEFADEVGTEAFWVDEAVDNGLRVDLEDVGARAVAWSIDDDEDFLARRRREVDLGC